MSVHLKKETEERLREQVASGTFRSEEDVVRAGLELIEDSEALRKAVDEGEAQIAVSQIITASESRVPAAKSCSRRFASGMPEPWHGAGRFPRSNETYSH